MIAYGSQLFIYSVLPVLTDSAAHKSAAYNTITFQPQHYCGCGFSAGDFGVTRTRTCPTRTRLPARVRKPVTNTTHHLLKANKVICTNCHRSTFSSLLQ